MPSDATRRSSRDILRIFLSGRMLTALLMGFSSGLPLLLATGFPGGGPADAGRRNLPAVAILESPGP